MGKGKGGGGNKMIMLNRSTNSLKEEGERGKAGIEVHTFHAREREKEKKTGWNSGWMKKSRHGAREKGKLG